MGGEAAVQKRFPSPFQTTRLPQGRVLSTGLWRLLLMKHNMQQKKDGRANKIFKWIHWSFTFITRSLSSLAFKFYEPQLCQPRRKEHRLPESRPLPGSHEWLLLAQAYATIILESMWSLCRWIVFAPTSLCQKFLHIWRHQLLFSKTVNPRGQGPDFLSSLIKLSPALWLEKRMWMHFWGSGGHFSNLWCNKEQSTIIFHRQPLKWAPQSHELGQGH